jgi:vacuolar-type H+-ATPase subunit I/STV1
MKYLHKYNEQDQILSTLNLLIKRLKNKQELLISNQDLDQIISKYYVDFYLEKGSGSDDINIGYTNAERVKLRQTIRSLVNDILNLNLPQEFTIKDK